MPPDAVQPRVGSDVWLHEVAVPNLEVLPLFAAIAVLIRRDSPGPAFYRAVRIGRYGEPFRMFKFRTMVADADRIGQPSTAAGDPPHHADRQDPSPAESR